MIFTEHFQCPECGQSNRVDWDEADSSPREVDCLRCRRDVPAALFFDDGREPSTNCTCSPLNFDAHIEGARFSITKFNGPTSGIGVPDLADVKAQRIKLVRDDLDAFVATHYDTPAQQALMALMVEALATGNTPRLVYVSQAISWVKGVIALFYPLRDQILSATTAIEVLAVSFDAMATPPDPMVTIEHALSL